MQFSNFSSSISLIVKQAFLPATLVEQKFIAVNLHLCKYGNQTSVTGITGIEEGVKSNVTLGSCLNFNYFKNYLQRNFNYVRSRKNNLICICFCANKFLRSLLVPHLSNYY